MEKKRIVSLALAAVMSVGSLSVKVIAEESGPENGKFVLMNIPYDKFYEGEGYVGVDIVSGATLKTYNLTMAAGSYHAGYDAVEDLANARILGVTYPVYVEDPAVLAGFTEVTDNDTAEIDVAQGRTGIVKTEVSGKDLLFASGDYAYYVLKEEPTNYKTVEVGEEGLSFSAVKNGAEKAEGLEVNAVYTDHHVDVVLQLTDSENLTDDITVTGAVVKTEDGSSYVLQHVTGIWRKKQLGWNWDGMDGNGLAGKKIVNITYYFSQGEDYKVLSYDVDTGIKLQPAEISAVFESEKSIAVEGLPEDIENPKATVATVVGRGETPVVIAENVDVVDGMISLEKAAAWETEYRISITSDNYADTSAVAVSPIAYTGFKDAEGNEIFFQLIDGKLYWFEEGEKQGVYGDPLNIWDTQYDKL
ncbi:MAG: hypothetical protein IKD69_01670 [Solobacterium sp.]|nr:hypothetical protein [Solobacterium sp.]